MEFMSKKTRIAAAAIAAFALCSAGINYAQLNRKGSAPSLVTVVDAKASDQCVSFANSSCYFFTSDGLFHETTNAENL